MSWLVMDTETTIQSLAKRKASPFHPDNYVVMMGWATKDNPHPTGERYQNDGGVRVGQRFTELLGTPGLRFVVGVNIKFDILHLIKDPATY